MAGETTWDCACPFLDGDPKFAFGVEFGMLYARLRDPDCDLIEDFFTRANQDQITLAASRLGWRVAGMKNHDEFWTWFHLERNPS